MNIGDIVVIHGENFKITDVQNVGNSEGTVSVVYSASPVS